MKYTVEIKGMVIVDIQENIYPVNKSDIRNCLAAALIDPDNYEIGIVDYYKDNQ